MTGLRIFGYLLRTAIKSFRHQWLLQLLTVATLATSFFLLGGAGLALKSGRALLRNAKGMAHASAFFRNELKAAEQKSIVERICGRDLILRCEYRSATRAREIFMTSHPELKAAVDSISENPFPPSLEIDLDPKIKDPARVKNLMEEIRALREVEEVDDGGGWVDRWIRLLGSADKGLALFGAFLGLAMAFVVSTTIQLVVYARRNEVEILDLIGATPGLIRLPFVLEGIFQGAMAGVLALVGLRFAWELARRFLLTQLPGYLPLAWPFFSPLEQLAGVLFGAGVGAFGSYLAVRHYLKE